LKVSHQYLIIGLEIVADKAEYHLPLEY